MGEVQGKGKRTVKREGEGFYRVRSKRLFQKFFQEKIMVKVIVQIKVKVMFKVIKKNFFKIFKAINFKVIQTINEIFVIFFKILFQIIIEKIKVV